MAAPKVGGKGLNGKIGPVPVKAAVFVIALIGGYLLFRHYQANKSAPTSSGTQPNVTDTSPYTAPQDATGGGASGGGGQDSSLFDGLFALVGSSNQSLADALASESQRTPTTTTTTTNTYYPSTGGTTESGGGNTSPPTATPTPSQPPTTHPQESPFVSPQFLTQIATGATSGASSNAIEKENQAAWTATETAYAPGTPLSSANYGGNQKLTTKQTKARNKRQLA